VRLVGVKEGDGDLRRRRRRGIEGGGRRGGILEGWGDWGGEVERELRGLGGDGW
jgi:hypothetical protein